MLLLVMGRARLLDPRHAGRDEPGAGRCPGVSDGEDRWSSGQASARPRWPGQRRHRTSGPVVVLCGRAAACGETLDRLAERQKTARRLTGAEARMDEPGHGISVRNGAFATCRRKRTRRRATSDKRKNSGVYVFTGRALGGLLKLEKRTGPGVLLTDVVRLLRKVETVPVGS